MAASVHSSRLRLMAQLWICAVAQICVPGLQADDEASTTDSDFEFLAASCVNKEAEVITVDVRYRSFRQFQDTLAPISRDAFREALQEVRSQGVGNLCEAMAKVVLADPGRFPTPWVDTRYVTDGNQSRNDDSRTIRVFDGETEVTKRIRRGFTDVILGSELQGHNFAYDGLSTLRWIPSIHEMDPGRTTITRSADGFVLEYSAANQTMRVQIADDSLLATEAQIRVTGGEPLKDIFQFDIAEVESGIFFPMRSAVVDYESGHIRKVELVEIDSIRVNAKVNPSDFLVSTSPGELVRDFRHQQPEMFMQKRELPDALQSVPLPGTPVQIQPPPPDASSGVHWGWLLSINGLVLVTFGAWQLRVWLRKRRSP